MEAHPTAKPDPWAFALAAIEAERRTVLVIVVDHSGSVPGVTGTFVMVTPDGQAGTIGGGAAEHALVERARGHDGPAEITEFVHTETGDGTLCNGVQKFAVVPLGLHDAPAIREILTTLREHDFGTLAVGPGGVSFTRGGEGPRAFHTIESGWMFTDQVGLADTLTIIGGGHVALALSRVMATLPFRIVVLDNRDELETMAGNSFAHERRVIDYDRVAEYVPDGDRSWVVVMTFGHEHDRDVVERLLGHDVRYLGLMGSASKVKRLFAEMEAKGANPEALSRVRAPIGMNIRSHTPEEIAISIAGEIIGIRNGAIE
jgi:xanthine dehydrogenase accessory factor